MKIKSCLFCRHCEHVAGSPLSECTWDSGEIYCKLTHWHMYGYDIDLQRLGNNVQQAESCTEYTPPE